MRADGFKLIAGLGNPGSTYVKQRHNVGFRFVDHLAKVRSFAPWKRRFNALVTVGLIDEHRVFLIKPMTFMNRSGQPLRTFCDDYSLKAPALTVVHDELDLKFGTFRCKTGGGDGGHNGLKSISASVGRAYQRLRIGIGRPPQGRDAERWVLANFSAKEALSINLLIHLMVEEIAILLAADPNGFSNRVHAALVRHARDRQRGQSVEDRPLTNGALHRPWD